LSDYAFVKYEVTCVVSGFGLRILYLCERVVEFLFLYIYACMYVK